jgi:LPXTG-motif cell wall-anchored protein
MLRFRATLASGTLVVLGLVGLALVWAPNASADTVKDVIAKLKTGPLYVATSSTANVGMVSDRARVEQALGDSIKVAVIPAGQNGDQIMSDLRQGLGGKNTIAVFVGPLFQAKSAVYCQGVAQNALTNAYNANSAQVSQRELSQTLIDFAKNLHGQPLCSSSANAASTDFKASGDSGSTVWPWLVGLGLVGAGGVGGLAFYRRRKKQRTLAAARARVDPYYDRLASEVNTLDPKDNATARQAVADAAERFNTAGSQLSGADTVEKVAAARRTTLEGLYAAVTARKALGLDPGPPVPPIEQPQGEQLTEAREVTVQGNSYQGYPTYTPGAPYYYGGGYGVPGGWYSSPFWETLLLTSVLTGGFGGGWGGGGYGAGYNQGYEAGQDSTNSSNDGGSWGGDTGGGGTDWGGGGGWGGGDGGGWGGGDGGGWGGGGGGDGGGGSW